MRSLTSYPLTDAGNAERLIAVHGEDLRYVSAWGQWLAWDGRRWERSHHLPFRWAKELARELRRVAQEDPDREKKIITWGFLSEKASAVRSAVELARHEQGVGIRHEELDADAWLLGVDNGTLDLRTGKLRPHARADLITRLAPVKFDARAKRPQWDAFLLQMIPNDEVRAYLQQLVGLTLVGEVRSHVLPFCYGAKGANGKSTFLRTIAGMLGEYAGPAPRNFLAVRFAGHPTELASFHGRRMVLASEVDANLVLDEALVKDLTGGDMIEARRMREDFWTFRPSHTMWVMGNHKPIVRGTDGGIWRRIRGIEWPVSMAEEQQDAELPAKLAKEWPGILNWAVEGCLAWQRAPLKTPDSVSVWTDEYRRESDTMGSWLRSWCVISPRESVPRAVLRKHYEEWCESEGHKPQGARALAARLKESGIQERTIRHLGRVVNGWVGMRLRSEMEGPVETQDNGRAVGTVGTLQAIHDTTPEARAHTEMNVGLACKVPTAHPQNGASIGNLSRIGVGSLVSEVPTAQQEIPRAAAPPSSPSPTSAVDGAGVTGDELGEETLGEWIERTRGGG